MPLGGHETDVGWYFNRTGLPLAERRHGKQWAIQATPTVPGSARSELASVSCTSPASCNAVGTYEVNGFAPMESYGQAWIGTSWQIAITLMPPGTTSSGLFSAACHPASCQAAGRITGLSGVTVTLVMHGT